MRTLNRLPLWQKFAILGVIGLLLTTVPLTLFIKESRKSVNAAALKAQGLAPARAVLAVVTLIQQHRGLSAISLSGNNAVDAQRSAKEQEVDAAFASGAPTIAATNEQIVQAWAETQKTWASLHQKVSSRTITTPTSFAEHTALVADLLKISGQIIDAYGLSLDTEAATYHLIDAALLQSPQLTETLGRMRARGSGVLTAKSADLQARATMIGMQSRAGELYASIETALAKASAAAPELQAVLDAPLRQTLTVGRETLQITQDKIVLPEQLEYPATDYFAKTTEAIGAQLKLYDAAAAELQRMLDARQATLRNAELMLGASVMLLALLGAAIGVLISRSITAPLGEAVAVARRIAGGDLSQSIEVDSNNETGQLLQALQDMNASLVKIVGEVRNGTDTIASASAEIATANMDLSSRTEAQASALEETASSMEEITGTVQQNAGGARQANELAREASQVAERGGALVAQVVETMSAIDASSRKAVDIISVINGIAFQTNILALNAAVEAARAGEQGRGFAVVASEVRNLAQRSAGAAKEIESLIKDSVQQASAGAKLAGQTGSTMEDIVTSIRRVSALIDEIAEASDQQSTGIAQVNQAVSEMDGTTQQNASLVEQAAAAAEALKDQADNLAQLVSVFKLSAHEGAILRTVQRETMTPALRQDAALRLAHGKQATKEKPAASKHRKRLVA